MSSFRIKGVLPPIVTPFTESGDIDISSFIYNIERWNQDRLAGLLVNGSNSEAAYLDADERLELVKLTVKYCSPERHIMAGTGCESLRETIRFTKACADMGAQSALVLTPSYYGSAMTSPSLISFFSKLADASPIPILIYNVPKFTHVNIKADAIKELSCHPNIVGMKDSTGDVPQLVNFKRVAGPTFQILVGTASAWFPALTLGLEAGIMALANCHPNECALVQEAWDRGDYLRARKIYEILFPVNTAVTATYGVPGLKFACETRGYKGGRVRSPLLEISSEDQNSISNILEKVANELNEMERSV